ncbi:hypothetical protein Drorol1_Dr00022585 [Drosera rotundifolia]
MRLDLKFSNYARPERIRHVHEANKICEHEAKGHAFLEKRYHHRDQIYAFTEGSLLDGDRQQTRSREEEMGLMARVCWSLRKGEGRRVVGLLIRAKFDFSIKPLTELMIGR